LLFYKKLIKNGIVCELLSSTLSVRQMLYDSAIDKFTTYGNIIFIF